MKTIAFPILGGGIFRGCRSLKEVVAANLRGICAGAYEGWDRLGLPRCPYRKMVLFIGHVCGFLGSIISNEKLKRSRAEDPSTSKIHQYHMFFSWYSQRQIMANRHISLQGSTIHQLLGLQTVHLVSFPGDPESLPVLCLGCEVG